MKADETKKALPRAGGRFYREKDGALSAAGADGKRMAKAAPAAADGKTEQLTDADKPRGKAKDKN